MSVETLKQLAEIYQKNRDAHFAEAERLEQKILELRAAGNQFAGAWDAVQTALVLLEHPEKIEDVKKELGGIK